MKIALIKAHIDQMVILCCVLLLHFAYGSLAIFIAYLCATMVIIIIIISIQWENWDGFSYFIWFSYTYPQTDWIVLTCLWGSITAKCYGPFYNEGNILLVVPVRPLDFAEIL